MYECYSTIDSAYELLDRLFPPLTVNPSVSNVETTKDDENTIRKEAPCVWAGNPERCFPKRAYFNDNPMHVPYMDTCYTAITKENCEMKPCEKNDEIRSEGSLLCVQKPEGFVSCEQSNCEDPLIATLCRLTCLGKRDQTK